MSSIPHLCPCGCGRELERYNGQRSLVCYSTWRRVPERIREQWMSSTSDSHERRVAAFEILRVARAVKAERETPLLL